MRKMRTYLLHRVLELGKHVAVQRLSTKKNTLCRSFECKKRTQRYMSSSKQILIFCLPCVLRKVLPTLHGCWGSGSHILDMYILMCTNICTHTNAYVYTDRLRSFANDSF